MSKGIVLFWNRSRGFGFAKYVSGSEIKKIYIHGSSLVNSRRLRKHQYIQFDIGKNDKGEIAENVEVIDIAEVESDTRRESDKTV
jgi:cold shock CspA family protein